MQKYKVLVVLLFLLMASLACYSDSPLWVFGVTDVPPTATFLPTPDYDQYPAKLRADDFALAPRPPNATQPFFFLTSLPEELVSGVRNASGSCDYGASLEILYIGQQFDAGNTTVYIDDIVLSGTNEAEEAIEETAFDFEAETNWTLDESAPANKNLARRNNVNFDSMAYKPEDDTEEPPEVANSTYVMTLEADYNVDFGNKDNPVSVIPVAAATADLGGADWSSYDEVSARIFVPNSTKFMRAELYIVTAEGNEVSTPRRINLTSGDWSTITFDIGAVEGLDSVQSIGLRVGPNPSRSYYLVACSGSVGWVNEERVAGPVDFVRGQSAQTKLVDYGGRPLPETTAQPGFVIHDLSEPPLPPGITGKVNCNIGEVVDIVDIATASDPNDQSIWYQIRCPVTEQQGWVTADRLFGPLVLPREGGIGIISSTYEQGVELATSANPSSDDTGTEGTCAPNQIIETVDFQTVETEPGVLTPYYEIQCGDIVGWLPQEPLIEIPYLPGTQVIAIGEDLGWQSSADKGDEAAAESGDEVEAIEAELGSYVFADVPIRTEPRIELEGNQEGTCPSGSLVHVGNVQSDLGLIFYEATCTLEVDEAGEPVDEVTGWFEARWLRDSVPHEIGDTLWFIEPTTDRDGEQEGFAIRWYTDVADPNYNPDLNLRPGFLMPKEKQCKLFTPIEIVEVSFERRALSRLAPRLYYHITCTSIEDEEIEGWVELDQISQSATTRNPNRPLG